MIIREIFPLASYFGSSRFVVRNFVQVSSLNFTVDYVRSRRGRERKKTLLNSSRATDTSSQPATSDDIDFRPVFRFQNTSGGVQAPPRPPFRGPTSHDELLQPNRGPYAIDSASRLRLRSLGSPPCAPSSPLYALLPPFGLCLFSSTWFLRRVFFFSAIRLSLSLSLSKSLYPPPLLPQKTEKFPPLFRKVSRGTAHCIGCRTRNKRTGINWREENGREGRGYT